MIALVHNVDISAPGPILDDVMELGTRVLLIRQRRSSENGVWIWHGSFVRMTRAVDPPKELVDQRARFEDQTGDTTA